MFKLNRIWAFLVPFLLALTSCSASTTQRSTPSSSKSAQFNYIVDVSVSPATMNNDTVARAVDRRIGNDMQRDIRLGDSLSVHEAGGSDVARMVGLPTIVTGYKLHIPAAHARLMGQMHEIAARFHTQGGDNTTHLIEALEAIHPDCSSGRDVVTLVTDGLEEDGEISTTRALVAGKPINLPAPAGQYLTGCRKIVFLGFGLTDNGTGKDQLLPPHQLAALRKGWTTYLQSAGVNSDQIEFVSIL